MRDAVPVLLQSDLLERGRKFRVLFSYNGSPMNAEMIAAWAVENGFLRIGVSNYRRHDDSGVITLEIKRLSYLIIDERRGLRPRLVSRLFKEMALPRAGASLQVLSPNS